MSRTLVSRREDPDTVLQKSKGLFQITHKVEDKTRLSSIIKTSTVAKITKTKRDYEKTNKTMDNKIMILWWQNLT